MDAPTPFSSGDNNKPRSHADRLRQSIHQHPRYLLAACLIILLIIVCHFISSNHKKPSTPLIEVVTATAQQENVPVYLLGLGAVTPVDTVTVQTQVNGILLRVLFKEGQMVKKGELIAQIDSRPYLAQMEQDEGQLVRDKALLANAKTDLKRYQVLWSQDSVSEQTLATQKALVIQYQGAVQLDQGLIQSTKVNLSYCNITSPVDGRIGIRVVDPGNFVQTSSTSGIVVITTLNPITVIFTLPEDNIPEVMRHMQHGKKLTALAYDRSQTKLLAKGTLSALDNEVEPTTGTVKLRAKFENKQNRLFPNQFVNIKLLVDTLQKAIVVPTAAIQRSAEGTFVYLVNPNTTVSIKPVTVDLIEGDKAVISKGISLGQSVVVDGVDQLTEGTSITTTSNIYPPAKNRKKT
ncbi:MAG: MdtA/MuxA family multidrug efflux RND transporter periplasmic adaptor subunit [Legionellales bacterium]|nr:MdtA/MuxA family multidrug efflux RND transporter periplasmic adaptor subunit [Legionellales bacterium]